MRRILFQVSAGQGSGGERLYYVGLKILMSPIKYERQRKHVVLVWGRLSLHRLHFWRGLLLLLLWGLLVLRLNGPTQGWVHFFWVNHRLNRSGHKSKRASPGVTPGSSLHTTSSFYPVWNLIFGRFYQQKVVCQGEQKTTWARFSF